MHTFCHTGRLKVAAIASALLISQANSYAAEAAGRAAPAAAAAPAHATPAPNNAAPNNANAAPTAAPAHTQAREQGASDDNRSGNHTGNHTGNDNWHHHNGSALLIPGYYGDNYWDNGWVNNQSAYYGQFQQNDNNTDQPAAAPDQTPAYYDPPGQSDSPSLSAALKASPAYMEADAQERAAQSEYDAISQRVIDKLKQSPDYQQALQTKKADAAKVSAVKANDPSASPAKTEPAAQAKLNAAKSVSDMQRDALAADPQAVAAKEKLDDAVAKREAIRAQVRASLPNAPAVKH